MAARHGRVLPELAREAGSAAYGDEVPTAGLNRAGADGLIHLGRAAGVATGDRGSGRSGPRPRPEA